MTFHVDVNGTWTLTENAAWMDDDTQAKGTRGWEDLLKAAGFIQVLCLKAGHREYSELQMELWFRQSPHASGVVAYLDLWDSCGGLFGLTFGSYHQAFAAARDFEPIVNTASACWAHTEIYDAVDKLLRRPNREEWFNLWEHLR